MRVAVTGTPGTGKTTATELLDTDRPVVHANELLRERGLWTDRDEERGGSLVADLEALEDAVPEDALVESHLAHHLAAERVVVLRCHPDELRRRLRERGEESDDSIAENAESEALDVILAEAIERHGRDAVYEIDTTDRTPGAVAAEIDAVLAGNRDPSAGAVDFADALEGLAADPGGREGA